MKILFDKKYPAIADGKIKEVADILIYSSIGEYTTSTYMLIDMLRLYLAQGKLDNLSVTDEETGYTINFTKYGTYPSDCNIPRNFNIWSDILHQLLNEQDKKYKQRKTKSG